MINGKITKTIMGTKIKVTTNVFKNGCNGAKKSPSMKNIMVTVG
jgi:hypothetical protein